MNVLIPEHDQLLALTQSELKDIIKKHEMYLRGQIGGARANLKYRNLSGLDFSNSTLSQADFTGSLFIEANLYDSTFIGCSFFACDLRSANMRSSNFSRADFRGAYVAGANLMGANMTDADLRTGKIMMRGESGELVDRKRAGGIGGKTVFAGAKLTRTNMEGLQAIDADFSDADLSGVNLIDANLSGSSFEGANLSDANFTGANLSNVSMRSAIMTGAMLGRTERIGLDLSAATTQNDMGSTLEKLGKTLPELLEEHTLWIATAGRSGQQLDLSRYDLRDVLDLNKIPLTAIKCVGGNFINQDLSGVEMQSAIFDRSDFRDCKMVGSDLRGSSFKYAKLSRVDLTNAKLGALKFNTNGSETLKRTDMSGASLRYSTLSNTDLRDGVFMGADLSHSVARDCDLRRADFSGAVLSGMKIENCRMDGAIIDFKALK